MSSTAHAIQNLWLTTKKPFQKDLHYDMLTLLSCKLIITCAIFSTGSFHHSKTIVQSRALLRRARQHYSSSWMFLCCHNIHHSGLVVPSTSWPTWHKTVHVAAMQQHHTNTVTPQKGDSHPNAMQLLPLLVSNNRSIGRFVAGKGEERTKKG